MSSSTSAAPIYPAHAASSPQFGRGAGLKLWMLPVIGLLTACSPKLQKGDTYTVIPADRFEAVAGSIVNTTFPVGDDTHKRYANNVCAREAYQSVLDSLNAACPIGYWTKMSSESMDYPKATVAEGVAVNGDDVLRTVSIDKKGAPVVTQRMLTDSTVTHCRGGSAYTGDGFEIQCYTAPLTTGLRKLRGLKADERQVFEASLSPVDNENDVPSDSTAVLPVPVKKTKKGNKRRIGNPGNSGGN